ncbi:MAG: peptide ABC transporter substrate-binding protein [Oscillospiraceae bacterium]|jgi:oligopeptide transport system substrate-binding protein|nr:peptide ABC transporter substrate-binding protein [Oscillospiraceae bacterium]
MKTKIRRYLKASLALLLLPIMVFSLAACQSSSPSDSESPSGSSPGTDPSGSSPGTDPGKSNFAELVVHVGPDPDTIDPALNSAVDGATLIAHAFEGLYSLDENGIPVPAQAESVDISGDGLTYTFKLRSGLKWSDGSPITAGDFVYAWARAVDPDTGADYEYMFESIAGYDKGELEVAAPDDNTIVVKLVARTPYFLELMAFPTFFPVKQNVVEANGDAWATKVETYIGNGPYKMVEWTPGSHITYAKNENYWNVGALGPERIKFLLMDDDNAILASYMSGGVKFIDTVPNDEIDNLRSRGDFFLEGQLGTYYISFNCAADVLDNPQFRKALTLAVDRDYITKEIGKAGQENAGGYVSTGVADAAPGSEFRAVGGNYYDPSPAAYEANLAEAKAIIAELYPDGNVPTLEYLYNTSTAHQLIGEALQQMWKEIGVTVTLQVQEWNTFLNTRKNGEYQIARNGWLCDYNDPMTMLDMWITGGGNNDAQWSNAEYDSLISQAKNSSDQAERMRLMHQAEDILFDEWVLCPIYFYVDIYMIDGGIDGFYSSPLGLKYFMYATPK